MLHLVTVIADLGQRQVAFQSLSDGAIDTTTATGELVFHMFSALAQFERRLIQERTRAGLVAARARGKHGGRQPLRADAPQVRMAHTLSRDPRLTVPEICQHLHISRATFYRYVALARQTARETAQQ
jgi:DNA invertase Pin-like site-specific DNA recombinase